MPPTYVTYRSNLPKGVQARFKAHRGYYAGPPVKPKPAPLTDLQQAQKSAAQITDPLIAAIKAESADRMKAGGGAITGYTERLAQQLAEDPARVAGIYGGAQQQQAGTDAALAQLLAGQGTDLAAGLKTRLAGIDNPAAVDPALATVTQTGTGSAGALYGTGSASMADLIARSASGQEYAAKQPGIARLGGLQQLGQLQQEGAKDVADQTRDLRAGIPEMVQTLLGQRQSSKLDQQKFAQAEKQQRIETLIASGYDPVTGQLSAKARAQLAALTGSDPVTGKPTAKTAAASAKAGQPNASLSKVYGHVVDSTGRAIVGANGKPVPVSKSPGKAPTDKRPAAIKSANSTALSIIKAAATPKKTAATGDAKNPFGGGGGTAKVVRARVGSEAYNRAIHQAEAAIAPLVSTYMTPAQITQFVQRLANQFFAPATAAPAVGAPVAGGR